MTNRRLLTSICTFSIATGAIMHMAGLYQAVSKGFDGPWWMYAVFLTAILGYSASAVGIVLEKKAAFIFAILGPAVGGTLIFAGLLSPSLDYEILIPGTFSNEIRPIGFVTLVIEPLAVLSSFLLLMDGKVVKGNRNPAC